MRKKNPDPAPQETLSGTANTILDVAERLAQTRGYNGFSYADIAAELAVTKASLHYHFRSKAELGRALIDRYHTAFAAALDTICQETSEPAAQLRRYVSLYDAVIRNDRMCLCGMLAAEYETLPGSMQDGLKQFFDMNEHWLTAVLKQGLQSGSFKFKESANERARFV